MLKLKKLLLKVLKLVSVGFILLTIILIGNHEIDEYSYKEVSSEEFIQIAIDNNVDYFNIHSREWKMETPSGQKFSHKFSSFSDAYDFKDKISHKINNIGYSTSTSFYPWLLNLLAVLIIFTVILNLVLVWLFTFFDLLKSEFSNKDNKWIWFISLIILPFISPFFYLFIAENQKVKLNG